MKITLKKEAKKVLRKAFFTPFVGVGIVGALIGRGAHEGAVMDAARHTTPLLGEWNQLEAVLTIVGTSTFFGIASLLIFAVYLHVAGELVK